MPQNFEKFLSQHSKTVLNLAKRILGNSDLANDAHQEVFLSVWKRWYKFDEQTNWPAYLYRVTVRKSMDVIKRNKKMPQLFENQQNPSTNCKADENLKLSDLQQKLAKALAKLPKRQAEIFILSKLQGLKNKTIAETLGCSDKTIRVHLHRARTKLAQQLSDYMK